MMYKGIQKPGNVWRLVLDFPGRRYQIGRCIATVDK